MRRKTIFAIFAVVICFGVLSFRGGMLPETVENGMGSQATTEVSYRVDMSTLENVLYYSEHIVKATLNDYENFTQNTQVYEFTVVEDFTENTDQIIYMYDAYDEGYEVGNTYYLFLSAGESPLYPHTIYTSTRKDIVVDVQKTDFVLGEESFSLQEIDDMVLVATAQKATLAETEIPSLVLFHSEDISEVAKASDAIVAVKVSREQPENKYASTYAVEYVETVKGETNTVPSFMLLPPSLEDGGQYFLFLQKSAVGDGEYHLFASQLPVIEATQENARMVNQ